VSNALYPSVRGLTWPVMKTSKESTIVQTGPNGTTTRNPQWINPMWDFALIYEYLKNNPYDVLAQYAPYTDYEVLQGFYLARQGQFDDFLFDDLSDDTVGPAVWCKRTWYPVGAVIIDPSGHQQTALQNGNSGSTAPTWNDSGGITSDAGQRWQDGGLIAGSAGQALSIVNDGAGNYYSPLQRNFGGLFLEDVTDLNTNNIPLRLWLEGVTGYGYFPASNYVTLGPGVAIAGHSFMGYVISWGWRGSTAYAANAPIIDPNGNLQIVTAGGGGHSGSSAPSWNVTIGGTTSDGSLTWTNKGAITSVTASFQFYFRVRFATDQADFEEFLFDIWTVGGSESKNGAGYLKLMSSRAPGV
jgi:hypothetical protein